MNRRLQLLTAGMFLTFLFSFSVLFFLLPDQSFSASENRSLRTVPAFTAKGFFEGAYSGDINDYFSDQFPFRDFWVAQKAQAELLLGKGENDGILIARDGTLAKRLLSPVRSDGTKADDVDTFDEGHIVRSLRAIERARSNTSVPFEVLLTDRNIDIARSSFSYPSEYGDALWELILQALGEGSLTVQNHTYLRACHERGEYVYYKTDHHWTTLGAYYAYCAIMQSFGMDGEILPAESFRRVCEPDFYGTLHSAAGIRSSVSDVIELWYANADSEFEIFADKKTLDGFFQTAHFAGKDKYSVFLDGTHDVVTVKKKDGENRPRLLLVKDSFANCVAPFLAEHFDLVLLNLSSAKQDFTNVSALADRFDADRVLLLYSIENMITADKLIRLH